MRRNRLIPILLIHKGGLWKTERFKPTTYVGDPTNAVRIFNDKQVDELIVLDIDASRERRGPNFSAVERLASECFMPLCYGGGIRSSADAERLFAIGAEKVALNSVLRRSPEVITEIAAIAGRQAVVASLDVLRHAGEIQPFDHVHERGTQGDWLALVNEYADAGAGEILVNCVDLDGTLAGPDLEVAAAASRACSLPLIMVGGVRSVEDARAVVEVGASAVGAGAMFVYRGKHRAVLITYPDAGVVNG